MAIFKGAGVAIVTPMKENEEVNYDKLEELVEWQIEQGTDAIVIVGTTGESSTLTTEEHSDVIRAAVRFAKHRVPVIAGTGFQLHQRGDSPFRRGGKGRSRRTFGCDPVLQQSDTGRIDPLLYRDCRGGKASDYHVQRSWTIPAAILCRRPAATLFKNVENIVGIKEATGSLAQASQADVLNGRQD